MIARRAPPAPRTLPPEAVMAPVPHSVSSDDEQFCRWPASGLRFFELSNLFVFSFVVIGMLGTGGC